MRSKTRYDLDYQEKIFAPDFFEFGHSGRVYNRQQIIQTTTDQIKAKLPLENFQVHTLDARNVLVTYINEVQHEELQRSNRSSIWTKAQHGWRIRFHQGTPTVKQLT